MSVSEFDLHEEFLESCIDGDIKHVLELAYYQSDLIQSLINAEIPCMNDNGFPGEYQPGEYIHAAAISGNVEIVAQLINLGAEPNGESRFGTPLEIACQNGGLDIIRLLHTHGVDLHPDIDIWKSPILVACEQKHDEIVQYIISVKPELLAHKSEEFVDGCILFCVACANENIKTVKLLAEKGVDINALVCLKDGTISTALDEACKSESEEIIRYLLQQHVEVSGAAVEQYFHILQPCFNSMKRKFTRSSSVKATKNSAEAVQNFISFTWSDKNLSAIHESWFSQNGDNIHSIELFHNKITELPENFFEALPNLEDLDISMNLLTSLPSKGLETSKLAKLSSSRNLLHAVPSEMFNNKFIQIIDLSHNKLRYLPPNNDNEDVDPADLSNYDVQWNCSNLVVLKLSDNQIAKLPIAIHGATRLEKLNLSNNELISFVSPWNCPLDDLDLSGNQLASFEHNIEIFWAKSLRRLNLSANQLPLISWNICHLENLSILDMSKNVMESLPPPHYWGIKSLNKLNLSHNKLSASCGPEGFADVFKSSVEIAMSVGKDPSFLSNCELPVECFQHCLQALDLSYNNLEMVPETICSLSALGELILSNNPLLCRLPPELGKLRNIWNLRLENLNLQDIPAEIRDSRSVHTTPIESDTRLTVFDHWIGNGIRYYMNPVSCEWDQASFRSSKKILAHLRGKLRKSVPFKRMKLMVVGLQGRGKTSLLATLQGKKVPSENIATVGISVEQWTLQPPRNQSKFSKLFSTSVQQSQEIVFSTWDLAGQHVYYSTHQCFLTSNTLYLVVWNVGHGQEGIDGLAPWLLNIQARAPKSLVIVVGTHLDKIPQSKRKERLTKLELDIFQKFGKKGFPQISGNVFVSNLSGDGLAKLKEVIYKVTSKMQDSNLLEPMIGKKVPLSYIQLYDAVTAETERRSSNSKAPILTTEEFLQLARANPDNDIFDYDELDHAARFLHDHGVLLHFNDHIRGLSNLYFIDPMWLCDMIALLVTVKEKNPFIKSGYIKTTDVMSVLKHPRLPVEFIPQFLQIMERFEIALRLDEEKILIPSMLPREKPLFLMQNPQVFDWTSTGGKDRLSKLISLPRNQLATQRRVLVEYIIRNYHLSYVPAGFWSRLIARLIIAVHKWGMIFRDQEIVEENPKNDSGAAPPKGVTKTTNYSMIYWREGIVVNYQAGNFLVESFKDDLNQTHACEGLSITVWSDFGDFSVMGFIVDQIDRLISEWYPGLEDLDEYGSMTVQRVIPCPSCVSSFRQGRLSQYVDDNKKLADLSHHFRNPEFVQQFSLSVCALAAVGHEDILCEKHPESPVPLSHLVPDLLLTDLPPSLLLDRSKLDFVPNEENRLGGGGAGEVFRAKYKGEHVAVKRFHSTKHSSNFNGDFGCEVRRRSGGARSSNKSMTFIPVEQTIGDQLEDSKVVRVFWELRQEVAVLCRLQHPFIIGFLGVCRIPLCFALELAPKGGLFSILDDIAHKRDLAIQEFPNNPPIMESVLGRKMTYKIALQVAHALLYLHESEIVYRDLKSDNVLVCTLDESASINVKLSDYGISCFATPQGVIGEGGTPGFQAPEVKIGCPYNEKVDIFSYAIWLHELITGHRPYREHRTSAEIRKSVNNGIRPSLRNSHVDSKIPYIESLMQDCWVASPASRPTAAGITRKMEDPRFLCLCNNFPKQNDEMLEHITCLFPLGKSDHEQVFNISGVQMEDSGSPLSGNKLLLWSGDGKNRKFIIIDNETGVIQNDLPSPGHRVLCAARVGQRIWLGTEGCQIEVFGRQYWQLPRVLWSLGTRDAIMDLLVEENKSGNSRVFASLANGTVLVFKRRLQASNGSHRLLQRVESQDENDRFMVMEKSEWEEPTVINLANEGRPAKSLVFTKDGKELWVASGNCIAIIDVSNLQLLEQVKVFTLQRYMINQLVTDGDRLWTIERRSATIYQWDVKTRQKTHKFDCDLPSDATGVVVAQPVTGRLFEEISDSPPMSPTANAEEKTGANQAADEVTSISNQSDSEPNLPVIGSFSSKNVRRVQPSFMFQRRNRKTKGRERFRHKDVDTSTRCRPRSAAVTNASMRLGAILLVEDTLWVGRNVGDVLVINVRKPTTNSVVNSVSYRNPKRNEPFIFGEVLCQFSDELMKQTCLLREVSLLKKVGTNHVVAVFRTEMDLRKRLDSMDLTVRKKSTSPNFYRFRFLIFEAWTARDFEQFSTDVSNLHALEDKY